MKPVIVSFLLWFVPYVGFTQKSSCPQDLEIVERAFNAFVTDSIRSSNYYFNASKVAEHILENCSINDATKKAVEIKGALIDLYGWISLQYSEMNLHKSPPEIKKFFERKIDSLKYIDDPAYQQYVSYLKGFIYATILKDYLLAISHYKEALKAKPDWVPLLHSISASYLSAGMNDSSETYNQDCFKFSKKYPLAYLIKARLTFAAKDFYGSVYYLNQALILDPLNPRYYRELGWKYAYYGMQDTAEDYYRKAITMDPKYILAHLELASIYWSQEKYQEATKLYEKCIEINPYLPDIYSNIADLKSEDEDDKLKYYKQAVKLDSSYMYVLGIFYHNKDEYEKAIQIYRNSMNYLPDKWVCRNIGACYYSLEEYKESIEFFEEALEFDSTYAEVHYLLGEIYGRTEYGNKEKALYHFKKAFLSEPSNQFYAEKYYPLAIADAIRIKDSLKAYETFYDLYKNGCDSCLLYMNALKYEYGFDTKPDKEESVEWYSIILRSNNSDFAWDHLLDLSDVWEKRKNNMGWDSISLFGYETINIPVYSETDSNTHELPITLYENYPKGMHPLLWEALRIKKEYNAKLNPDDRLRFLKYYTEAQRYNSPYPSFASYRYQYDLDDQQMGRFEKEANKIYEEKDPKKKLDLLEILITKVEDWSKNSTNTSPTILLAKAYLLYGEALFEQGNKTKALENLNKATAIAPEDTSIINKVSTIKYSMYKSVNDLLEISTQEELVTYIGYYLQKGDEKNADIIFKKLMSDTPPAHIRYSLYEAYLDHNNDMFDELLLSDVDENNIYDYRDYFTSSISNTFSDNDKVAKYEKLMKLEEKLLKLAPGKELRTEMARHYNSFGWFSLLSKDFSKAKLAISRGLELDNKNLYLVGNEPHVLLFTGQVEQAKKKYLELRDRPFEKESSLRTFKEAFLADFKDFMDAEFSSEDLEKIEAVKKILNKK